MTFIGTIPGLLLKEIIIREKKIGNFRTLIFKNSSKSMESPNFFPPERYYLICGFLSDVLLDREDYVKFDILTQRQHLSY